MNHLARRGRHPLRWLVLSLCCASAPAWAETLVVTHTGDSGAGSLRQAMLDAMASPAADEIVFEAAADGGITLASPLPDVLSSGGDLTISGNGAANTIIDGAGLYRPLKTDSLGDLHFTLRSLTLRNGYADQLQGGAMYIVGGGSTSLLTLDAVEFVGNEATYDGGAIYAAVPTVVENSLFEGNVAGTFGAAIYANGSAVLATNSTIVGNSASGGIIRVTGAGAANGPVSRLVNLTVAGNQSDFGVVRVWDQARVSLSNSLIAGNTYGTFGSDLTIDSGGQFDPATSFNNVIGREVDSGIQNGVNGNQVGVTNPLLGPLGDYGGPTRTAPLLPGSPALNAGTSAGDDIPASDQRGIARVGAVDVGAFESQGFTLDIAGGDSQSTVVSTPFADPLKVAVAAIDSLEPVAGGAVHFSAPASGPSAVFAAPEAIIGSDGAAQAEAIANGVVGGPYVVAASLSATQSVDFSLTNTATAGVCGAFTFPYTLAGADNAARVAELRQAIECANANISDDVIDLGGNTLSISNGPYTNIVGATALPFIASTIELRNGGLEREASAPGFRFIYVDSAGMLTVRGMALRGGSASGTSGGAILASGPYVESNLLTVIDSVFENNSAESGAAVASWQAVSVQTSRFTGNAAASGAAIAGRQMMVITNSRFEGNGDGNTKSVLSSSYYTGILNSLFADNHLTAAQSSLMYFGDTTVVAEFRNVTIAGNTVQGELLSRTSGSVQVRNCIVWDNEYGSLGNVSPIHSILPGFGGVNGNLDQAPGFVGPDDYHLDAGSPAIDAGDNSYGSFEDLDLNPRPLDDAGVADTGNGEAPLIDMGAYEYQTDSVAAGITVTPAGGLVTTEGGGTATFTVVLDRYPAADVTLSLSSNDTAEGLVAPVSLTFTQDDWNRPRTVTVTGLDDGVVDGDQAYAIVIAPASSADPAYAGIDPPDVAVVNEEEEIPPHHVGGTVIGLLGDGLVLSLDATGETLLIAADGRFAFAAPLASGAAYSVTVATQPQAPTQACIVINGSGTMGAVDIGNVVINCGASVAYAIGGTVDGLAGGGLTLQLNGGGDLALSADGSYAFLPRLVDGAGYVVTVRTQPQGQLCTLANASGTVAGADVADVDVSCAPLQASLHLSVDDGHAFARYGHVRDYFVTLGNSGNSAADGVAIAATFSAAFDVANVHWQCLGGTGLCGSDGAGGFADTANLPAGASVTWIVSVPVLAGSDADQATFTVELPSSRPAPAGAGLSDADTDTLVIFRDGVDVPYGDGTQAVEPLPPLESVPIQWPPASGDGIAVVRALQTPDGRVEVQRLTFGGANFARLLGADRAGWQHASEWTRVAADARLVVGHAAGAQDTSIVLLEGAEHPLALVQGASENTGEVQ